MRVSCVRLTDCYVKCPPDLSKSARGRGQEIMVGVVGAALAATGRHSLLLLCRAPARLSAALGCLTGGAEAPSSSSSRHRGLIVVLLLCLPCRATPPPPPSQLGAVRASQKISDTQGGFTGGLDDSDYFGRSVATLGDLDGVIELVVGAPYDDDGGTDCGAVWLLFLNSDRTVKAHQKIGNTQGGFTGYLDNGDYFGYSVASLGDLDGDGVSDLAVGARFDGGWGRGAVWLLLLSSDGTVKSHQKVSDTEGGFTGVLDDNDYFGSSVASLGDLDGDGVIEKMMAPRRAQRRSGPRDHASRR